MKKYLILIVLILFLFSSCGYYFGPTSPYIEVREDNRDIWWQMVKDGDVDTNEYQHYPTQAAYYYNIQPGDGYTLKFYIVTNTIMDGDVEKRVIGDTYETHIVIDHYENIISVTYTKEAGLGCKVEQSWIID